VSIDARRSCDEAATWYRVTACECNATAARLGSGTGTDQARCERVRGTDRYPVQKRPTLKGNIMTKELKRIIVATDGSSDARLAERAAADLATLAGAELHLVHAWMSASSPAAARAGLPDIDLEVVRREARAILDNEAEHIRRIGGTVTADHLRAGQPADKIVALSQELEADLIVVGSRGLGTVGRLLARSVAEEIINEAHCPVLVVRGDDLAWPPEQILIGDDGSAEAAQTARVAVGIGDLLGASSFLVGILPDAPVHSRSEVTDLAQMMTGAQQILEERAVQLTGEQGVQPTAIVRIGEPATALTAVTDEFSGPSLLAVGRRGLGRIARMRFGSVSTATLREASCPVLIGLG